MVDEGGNGKRRVDVNIWTMFSESCFFLETRPT